MDLLRIYSGRNEQIDGNKVGRQAHGPYRWTGTGPSLDLGVLVVCSKDRCTYLPSYLACRCPSPNLELQEGMSSIEPSNNQLESPLDFLLSCEDERRVSSTHSSRSPARPLNTLFFTLIEYLHLPSLKTN